MKIKQVILYLLVITGLIACKKSYDLPPVTAPVAQLNVINTTPNAINYYLNGTRQNYTSSIYTGGYTGYLAVTSGQQNYEFRNNGSATTLFNKSVFLKDSTNQTLYVAGTTADKTFLTLDTATAINTASRARFAHTADGAGTLSIAINDTVVFANQTFQSVSAYKKIGAGPKVVKVYAGSSTIPGVTQKLTLSTGNVYTFYVRGLPNGVGQSALTFGYFVNR